MSNIFCLPRKLTIISFVLAFFYIARKGGQVLHWCSLFIQSWVNFVLHIPNSLYFIQNGNIIMQQLKIMCQFIISCAMSRHFEQLQKRLKTALNCQHLALMTSFTEAFFSKALDADEIFVEFIILYIYMHYVQFCALHRFVIEISRPIFLVPFYQLSGPSERVIIECYGFERYYNDIGQL